MAKKALIDGREFTGKRFTGIGRVLEGLTHALAQKKIFAEMVLAVFDPAFVTAGLKDLEIIRFNKRFSTIIFC